MIDDLACLWSARLDRGLEEDEREALGQWLANNPRHQGALLRAQAALSLLDRGRALGGSRDPAWFEPHGMAPETPHTRRHLLRLGGGGVAAAIVAAAGWRLWRAGTPIATGVGEIRRVPLADGSLAVVNSASRLRVAFTDKSRDIELAHGEAWFEVAKTRARPFTVAAGPVRAQAVGTAFDVRRHAGASEIVVTEGTVKVWSTASDAEPRFVAADNRALVSDGAGIELAPLSPNSSDRQLAWREGRIVLDNMTLAAAAREFNRYHDAQLDVAPALADRQVVGWFRTDDLDGFATASAAMVGGHVERERNVIRIVE